MIHVYPLDDIEEHDIETTLCKCEPRIISDTDADIIVVHNSFDGREGVEWANDILNNK